MMNIRHIHRLVLAAFIIAAFDPAPAQAFWLIQNFDVGRTPGGQFAACNAPGGFTHWSTNDIFWKLNVASGGSYAAFAPAMASATSSWNAVTPATYNLVLQGATGSNWETDGQNTVLFSMNSMCTNEGECNALTALTLGPGQVIIEADILFNAARPWHTDGADWDVEGVMAHELGHTLGINHAMSGDLPAPTMELNYFGVEMRSLEPDDRAALNCIFNRYPPAPTVVFQDVAAGTPFAAVHSGRGAAWANFAGSALPDAALSESGAANRLIENLGSSTFSALAVDIGANGRGLAWGDYDNDGDLDLYVARDGAANQLYQQGPAGTFTNVAGSAGVASTGGGRAASFVDVDCDGDLDLHVVNGGLLFDRGDKLYLNDGSPLWVFTDVSAKSGPIGDDTRRGEGAAWGDFDNDGDPDVLVVNSMDGNMLLRNEGGVFTDVTLASGGTQLQSPGTDCAGAAWGDYDNDGFLDLVVTKGSSQQDRLFHNGGSGDPPALGEVTFASGLGGDTRSGRGVTWADIDNDRDLDLFVANAGTGADRLYRNEGGSFFDRTASNMVDASDGHAASFVDFDRDGSMDLHVVNAGAGDRLYRNLDLYPGNWLRVKAVGNSATNRSGLGVRVTVHAPSYPSPQPLIREIGLGSGYLSQNELVANFGLGTSTSADLVVSWTCGQTSTLHVSQVNQEVTVTEPLPEVGLSGPAALDSGSKPSPAVESKASPEFGAVSLRPARPGNLRLLLTAPRAGALRLGVFDIAGRRVHFVNRSLTAGVHDLEWSPTDGGRLQSGVYFYTAEMAGVQRSGRVLIYY